MPLEFLAWNYPPLDFSRTPVMGIVISIIVVIIMIIIIIIIIIILMMFL